MADDYMTETPARMPQPTAPRGGTGRAAAGAALIAFILGAGSVGYFAWKGIPPFHHAAPAPLTAPTTAPDPARRVPLGDPATLSAHQGELETRMAELDQRLDTASAQADAASGNAARAEALLVAFAARRSVDRGAPLGYLEDQLRLRFGNSQPRAVATVIDAGHAPVTLDQLLAGLDTLSPSLTQGPSQGGAWSRVKREFSSLFVIRREASPSPAPQVMLQRARLLLEAGRTGEAIAVVQRLPGSAEAGEWMEAARRHDEVHRALDVLESAALLEPQAPRQALAPADTDAALGSGLQ